MTFYKAGEITKRDKQWFREFLANKPAPKSINPDQGWTFEVTYDDPLLAPAYSEHGNVPE